MPPELDSIADLSHQQTGMPTSMLPRSKARATHSKEDFAREYIKDFNLTLTANRCGMHVDTALDYVEDGECMAMIDEIIANMSFKDLISRNKIVAGLLREANHESGKGSHTARINAWDKLAKVLKMYEGEKPGMIINGGVMIVPVMAGQNQDDAIDVWEAGALPAQTELLETVRLNG